MPAHVKSEGFGFVPTESTHHFLVSIPGNRKEQVLISEHLNWDESEERRKLNFALGREDDNLRVILPRRYWDDIADAVRAEFNGRLRKIGLRLGQWKVGQTPVSRLFGKELVLLAWGIEDADPALIQDAIKNWLGLLPEERWWLFTMTNAATGHAIHHKGKGWRKAIRYALTENPVSDSRSPKVDMPLFQLTIEEALWSGSSEAGSVENPIF